MQVSEKCNVAELTYQGVCYFIVHIYTNMKVSVAPGLNVLYCPL